MPLFVVVVPGMTKAEIPRGEVSGNTNSARQNPNQRWSWNEAVKSLGCFANNDLVSEIIAVVVAVAVAVVVVVVVVVVVAVAVAVDAAAIIGIIVVVIIAAVVLLPTAL